MAMRLKELPASSCEPHFPCPAERCGAQKQFEMGLKCSRANASDIGEPFEPNWLGQVAAEPTKGAHYIGRQRAREVFSIRSSVTWSVLGNRIADRHWRRH